MWKQRAVMIGAALGILGGVGVASAQVLLHVQEKRSEEIAEQRIDDLRARATCYDQHAAARQRISATFSGNHLRPEDKAAREAQLREADDRIRECLEQLQAGVLRATCRSTARTEAQRVRCD
jgi:hypothetical protein